MSVAGLDTGGSLETIFLSPLIIPTIIFAIGMLMLWSSLFGATSFLARPDAPTVPVAMFRLLSQPGAALRGQAMALGTVLAVLTMVSVLVIERLRPKDALGW